MPSIRVSKDLNQEVYFITLTVHRWYYLFDRHGRWEILEDSLVYCQQNKNLEVFAYVFMLNHLHHLVRSQNISGFLRDFKKHTALELFKNLKTTEPSVAELFKTEGGRFCIWQTTNLPQLIQSEKFYEQKLNYIEENPVRKGYVNHPEHWVYSSANPKNRVELSRF